MSAQLELWHGDDTSIACDQRVGLSIRQSRRARRLILQALPPRTVEVVVPVGVRPAVVQSFIAEHQRWIQRAGRELLETYPEPDLRPAVIVLEAIGRTFDIDYGCGLSVTPSVRENARGLSVCTGAMQETSVPMLLQRWLLRQGGRHLKPWLLREAASTGLMPSAVQVRLQKTRWGSCSSSGRISLNAALLLVPRELVRYLFIHELCHLRHLSHSKRYWQTVARFEPDYRELDRRLGQYWQKMPAWLGADRKS